jgi:hypothetical protein
MHECTVIQAKSHGMWRRIWTLGVPGTLTEKDIREGKLSLELSGVFNWVLEG